MRLLIDRPVVLVREWALIPSRFGAGNPETVTYIAINAVQAEMPSKEFCS